MSDLVLLAYILGYSFSVGIGLLIGQVTDAMRGGESGETGRGWQMKVQGSVEQVLYTTSVLIGQSLFIGAWLGIKTAAQWQQWIKNRDSSDLFDRYLSPYLVGNALSVIVAITGANIIEWWKRGHYFLWLAPVAVALGITFLIFWADRKAKSTVKPKKVG